MILLILYKDDDLKASRFLEKYITKTSLYNIPDKYIRWYVRFTEQFIKAHSVQLKEHDVNTFEKYFQAKGRKIL